MRIRRNHLPLASVLAALSALAVASVAWACTQTATISIRPASGPTGGPVMVSGQDFGSTPVEIRWNGAEGPVLATASGPQFSVAVSPPAGAAPDVYVIEAVQTVGQIRYKISAALDLRATRGPGSGTVRPSDSSLWSGFAVDRNGISARAQAPAATTSDSGSRGLGLGLASAGLIGSLGAGAFLMRKRTAAAKH